MSDGTRTWSSSTFQVPSPSRTRWQPETWQYTPLGGRTSYAARANAGRETTSPQGTMPSRMVSRRW